MPGNRMEPVLDPRALARQLSNRLLIDGALVPAASGKVFPVVNPANQEHVGRRGRGQRRGCRYRGEGRGEGAEGLGQAGGARARAARP